VRISVVSWPVQDCWDPSWFRYPLVPTVALIVHHSLLACVCGSQHPTTGSRPPAKRSANRIFQQAANRCGLPEQEKELEANASLVESISDLSYLPKSKNTAELRESGLSKEVEGRRIRRTAVSLNNVANTYIATC
jgi:hypothetical protein